MILIGNITNDDFKKKELPKKAPSFRYASAS